MDGQTFFYTNTFSSGWQGSNVVLAAGLTSYKSVISQTEDLHEVSIQSNETVQLDSDPALSRRVIMHSNGTAATLNS